MFVDSMHAIAMPTLAIRWHGFPGTEVTDSDALSCGFRESNQRPMEELFTAEPSLQPHIHRSLKCVYIRQKARASLSLQ